VTHVPDQLVVGVLNTAWIATVSSTTPSEDPRCPPVTDTALIVSARKLIGALRQLARRAVGAGPMDSHAVENGGMGGMVGHGVVPPEPGSRKETARGLTPARGSRDLRRDARLRNATGGLSARGCMDMA
jgi:hypothetical protein